MRIDTTKLIKLIQDSPFGSGTLSESAGIHPDELQKLIGRGEGEEELVTRLEGILGGSFGDIIEEITPEETTEEKKTRDVLLQEYKVLAHDNTVANLQKMVKEELILPDVLVEAEKLRAAPRKTLLAWLDILF